MSETKGTDHQLAKIGAKISYHLRQFVKKVSPRLVIIGCLALLFSGWAWLYLTRAHVAGFVVAILCVLLLMATFAKDSFKRLTRGLMRLLFRVELHGLAHYALAGSHTVIMANYRSPLDLFLLSLFLPDKLMVAVRDTGSLRAKLWLLFVDVIHKDPLNSHATRKLITAVSEGKRCVIFHEQTFAGDPLSLKNYEGTGLVLEHSGASLLPVFIERQARGLAEGAKGLGRFLPWPKVQLNILPPVAFEPQSHLSKRERRQFYAAKVHAVMLNVHFQAQNIERTLFAALIDAKNRRGGQFQVCEDIQRQPLNYFQLLTRCFILGRQMALATEKSSYVGVMLPTTVTAMVTFFGLQAYGRIPAMLNFSLGISSLLSACHTANIRQVYTSKQFITTAKLEATIDALVADGIEVICLESFKSVIGIQHKVAGALKAFFAKTSYRFTASEVNQYYQPAVLLFTSGSEGTPKGVVHTHKSLLANTAQVVINIDFTAQDKMFNALPVFHCFGLTAGALLPLVYGIPCFFYPSPLHYRIIPPLVGETHATLMLATDTFLAGYARYATSADFTRMRYIFAGAEKVKASTLNFWAEKLGVQVLEGYGATEAAPVIALNTPVKHLPGSVGCLLSGITSRLDAVEGIHDGGRLHISGPNIMMGYILASQPGKLQPLYDGWHDTGDIVTINEHGFVAILDRAKRFAKVGGEMVSLGALETIAGRLWPDALHAVIRLPDAKKGESLVLFTEQHAANRQAIVDDIKARNSSELLVPKSVCVIESVPVLSTGKIDYVGLASQAESYLS